ncbi:MAG: FadR/GntR family transcriptional regulator [Chloroflexota bacterium]
MGDAGGIEHFTSKRPLNQSKSKRERVFLPKMSHIVAQQIRQMILTNRSTEGSALIQVKEIGERLGVASTTVREALRVLEAEGLVIIKPGPKGGVFVRHPSHENISRELAFLFQFENTSLSSYLEARRILEPICARLAADRAEETDIAALEASNKRLWMAQQQPDPYIWVRENGEFHVAVAVATHNDVLRILTTTLRELHYASTLEVSRREDSRVRTIQAHRDIVAAIKSRNAERAEHLMLEHLLAFERSLAEVQGAAGASRDVIAVMPTR